MNNNNNEKIEIEKKFFMVVDAIGDLVKEVIKVVKEKL